MELWQRVWRVLAKRLSTPSLEALHLALLENDERLLQGSTTSPPPLDSTANWPCEGACLIGYAGWQGSDNLKLVGEVEEFFAKSCYELDQELGEPAGCRHLLNWFDETPRQDMIKDLLPEVELALRDRPDRTA